MSELDNLVAQGAAIDAGIELESQEAAGIPAVEVDPMAAINEWMLVPELLTYVITAIYPETEAHYTEEKKIKLAAAIVPVAEKYGINGVGDSPELLLGFAAFGFAMPAWNARKARKLALENQNQQMQAVENGSQ